MLSELLVFGSMAFWVFTIVGVLIMTILVNTEKLGAATWALAIGLGALQFMGCPVWQTIYAHPQVAGMWALIYVGVGVLWAFVKWFLFVNNERAKYDDLKAEYLSSRGWTSFQTATPEDKSKWRDYLRHREIQVPDPKNFENKDRICGWIGYWPLSMAFTLINDPIRKIVRFAYRGISGSLKHIADRAFAGTENDLGSEE